MTDSAIWKSRPIFISSTFRDMHAERDFLRNNAFLRLAEQLRERCHYLDTIDLRQGVETASEADEAKREMQVLKVCLDEINRSKPFLVALVGERYGHVPPDDRITASARDAGLPPSVDVAGKSVTELEILYGVLENPDQKKRSWFYFRELDRTGMPPEVSARFPAEAPSDNPLSPTGKLRALKDRIRGEMPGRVREYPLRWDPATNSLVGLKELDERIARDLWSDLDAETAAYLRDAPKTWQEAESRAVADFAAERTRGYVERPAVTDAMVAHALSPASADWGLVVTAESGGGKSSLFGCVLETLQKRADAGELILLAHAAGIFPMSGQVDRMLKRWVTELASSLGIPDPLVEEEAVRRPEVPEEKPAHTSEDIDRAFVSLLRQAAAKRRVIVLVDALDQFEPTLRADYMKWLPRIWPDNVRFLATAIPGKAAMTSKDRKGCYELPVPPVLPDEAREIARRFYRERHHRDVNPKVVAALVDKKNADGHPAHGNPLWLALALQEMNLLEADDYERAESDYANLPGAERMQALQLDEAVKFPADVFGAYGELLARAESGFGKAWADAFVDLIAISRSGWRESDLKVLMPKKSGQPWDDLAFAALRRILGAHVVQRGAYAQWDFFHKALRETVLRRNLADATARRCLHNLIADHLHRLPDVDELQASELMYHLIGARDRKRAAHLYASVGLERGRQCTQALMEFALVPDDANPRTGLEWIASLAECPNLTEDELGSLASAFVDRLSSALIDSGYAKLALELMTASEGVLRSRIPSDLDQPSALYEPLAAVLDRKAEMLQGVGAIDLAIDSVRESISLLSHPRPRFDPFSNSVVWGGKVYRLASILMSQRKVGDALEQYNTLLSVVERLSREEPSLWWLHRYTGLALGGIATAQTHLGNLNAASQAGEESLRLARDCAVRDPANWEFLLNLAQGWLTLGRIRKLQDRSQDAIECILECLSVVRRCAQENPDKVKILTLFVGGWQELGDIHSVNGDVLAAQDSYAEAISACQRLTVQRPDDMEWKRLVVQLHLSLAAQLHVYRYCADGNRHWESAINTMRELHENASLGPAWQTLLEQVDSGMSLGDYARSLVGDASGARSPVHDDTAILATHSPSIEELRASAGTVFGKCLWDAASSMFERLLAAGDPIEDIGPKLVKCLLNIHEPPIPGEVKRAKEVIGQLEAMGRSDLVEPLRQMLAAKVPPEKKGFWKRMAGR